MEDMIKEVLKTYGLAGIVIMVLGWAVIQQYREARRVTRERLADVPVLVKALDNSTAATRDNTAAIQARNSITEELTKAIDRQALAFQMFTQKMDFEQDGLKDKISEYKMTIESQAEATRNVVAVLREIRDKVGNGPNVGGV